MTVRQPAAESALSRFDDRVVGAVALIAALPLFWDVNHNELTLLRLVTGTSDEDVAPSTRIHLVVPLVALLGLLALLRRRPSWLSPLSLLLWGILASFTVAVIWGYTQGAGLIGVLFYAQTVVPLVAWLAVFRLGATQRTIARSVMAGVIVTGVLAIGYTAMHGGIGSAYYSSRAFEAFVPQYRSYYPVLVALAVACAVTHWRSDRWLAVPTLVLAAALLPIMWSRAGIAMVLVAAYAALYLLVLRRPDWRRLVTVTAGVVAVTAVFGAVLATVGLATQRTQLSDIQASDQKRIDLARSAGARLRESPLTGDSFRPAGSDLAGGVTASFDRLFPTHNQYLDYALRGGLPALLLLLALLGLTAWLALRVWWRTRRGPLPVTGITTLAFLAALVPGALTELYISQTWSGVVIMMCLGHAARSLTLSPSDDGEHRASLSAGSPPTGGAATPSTR